MSIFYRQIRTMGTRLEIVIPGIAEPEGLDLTRGISQRMEDMVGQISNYDPESDLSKVNREATDHAVEVNGYLLELIEAGIRFNKETLGYYDFTLGGWSSRPDLIRDTGKRFELLHNIPFNERFSLEGTSLRFLHKDVRIDSGGIGKGMALKVIEKMIHELEIPTAFISFGGSSVLGIGNHPHGDGWKVGIQHPQMSDRTLSEVTIFNQSISVSGNSMNNRKKYGEQGHIINPMDGGFYMAQGVISVVAENPVVAEVLSTALTVAGEEHEKQILSHFEDVLVQRHEI
ncbi:MAG: FAD:protein FMN transferase [Bacteroidales bacterium]